MYEISGACVRLVITQAVLAAREAGSEPAPHGSLQRVAGCRCRAPVERLWGVVVFRAVSAFSAVHVFAAVTIGRMPQYYLLLAERAAVQLF